MSIKRRKKGNGEHSFNVIAFYVICCYGHCPLWFCFKFSFLKEGVKKMIKGTTKKARENARNLVDSMIDLSGYDDIHTTDKHAAIRDICAAEMGRKWSIDAFKEWCEGLPSAFDSAEFLYNGTPWDWLSRVYECSAVELDKFIKHTPRAVAEDRCTWWAFKVLDKD